MNVLRSVAQFVRLGGEEEDGGDDEGSPRSPRKRMRQRVTDAVASFKANLSSLNESPRELWVAYVLKFLDSYGYFSTSQILVIFLHQEFKISDLEAGFAYGIWGCMITFSGLVMSVLNDYLGVRRALLLGFSLSCGSYVLLANARSKSFVYAVLFFILPMGNALGIPMISIGIKRYTTPLNRGFAFGIFYSAMNLAAFVSGPIIDALTRRLGYDGAGVALLPVAGATLYTANRCVILSSALASFCSFWVTLLALREVRVTSTGELDTTGHREGQDEPWAVRREKLVALLSSRTFWRFSLFTLLLINLNAVFRHLDATFPTYLVRTFGQVGEENKGLLYSINPFLIILLVPVVAAATTSYLHFDMIKWGGYVTAAAPFCLAFATSIPAAVAMVVTLSLGEAIWSPRTYDYTYSIAPEGQEASFAALAAAPLFAAKIPVGLLSGYLLNTYCPEGGPNHGQTMWLIIGVLTLTSPLLITLLEPCIREPAARGAGVAGGAGVAADKGEANSGRGSGGGTLSPLALRPLPLETPWGDVRRLPPAGLTADSDVEADADADADAEGGDKEKGGGIELSRSSHALLDD